MTFLKLGDGQLKFRDICQIANYQLCGQLKMTLFKI